ncbi:hypothetical protein RF11_02235 [Thelohanellus kitauei]|uniref:Uncharacterized protein n=1 Tax=Thelohanellus kitauei TaxID=669202 RepID=A0A0C2MP40_THEKT|nr:hypothetical protein RF11_02235 [Thelohanellus kitauei]
MSKEFGSKFVKTTKILTIVSSTIQIEKSYVEEHVTAILKTGGRYEQLKTLLRTKNQSYPRMHIIIVDDEWNESFEKEIQIYKEATYVAMNESAGISKGGRYEQLKTLRRTKNQSYPRMLIIIVDDEWNESFEKEIKIYKEAPYVAMNESAGIPKGRFLTQLLSFVSS